MKKFGILSGLALAALLISNCATNELDTADEAIAVKDGVPFEVIASSVDTRTANDGLNTNWVSGDKINIFHADGNTIVSDGEFTVSNISQGIFSGTVQSNPVVGTSYDWYAIYPYDSNLTSLNTETNGHACTNQYYTIGHGRGEAQSQDGTGSQAHLAGTKMPMYGIAENVAYTGTGDAPFIQMNQFASVAAVTVTNTTAASVTIAKVEFTAPESIIGTFRFDILGSEPVYYDSGSNYVDNTATLNVTNGTIAAGATGVFYLAIKPFTAQTGQTITVKVTTQGGVEQTKTFTLTKAYTFAPGKIKTVKMNFTQALPTYTQIQSESDITADGKYVFVLADPVNNDYVVLNNHGEDKNLTNFKTMTKTNGLLQMVDPKNMFVWSVAGTSGSGFNFRNTDGNSYSCIYSVNNDTKVDTGYQGSQYWIPEYLSASGCFKLYNSNSTPRFLSHGANQTDVKAYVTSGTFHDQVAENIHLGMFCGAWAILKLGASALPAPQMSFSPSSVSIHLGDTFTAPTLTTVPAGLAVTYASDAPSVASVTSAGVVTIVGTGTATITATFAGNASYRPTTASYTIEVSASSSTEWVLAETLADVTEGQYVITWNNSLYLPNSLASYKQGPVAESGITVANKKLTNTVTNDMIWTFTGNNTKGFAVTGVNGSSTNRLISKNDSQGVSVIVNSNNTMTWKASIHATAGMLLKGSDDGSRYLAVYNSANWRYYQIGSSYSGTLRLYKKTVSDGKADAEIAYSPASGSVTYGATLTQPTLLNPHNLTGIQYSSGTPVVATVASDGTIAVVKPGTAVITAAWAEQAIGGTTYRAGSATFNLTVNKATPTVSFNSPTTGVLQGGHVTNTATTTPSGLTLTYSSGTPAVATVNSSTGEVTGVSAGTAVITATFAGNDYYNTASDTYTITVTSNGTPVTRTYIFTSKSWAATLNGNVANWTSGKDGNQFQNGRGVQVPTGASGANATSPVSFSSVSQVVVTYSTNQSTGAGAIKIKVGSGTEKSQNVTSSGGTTDRTLTYIFNPNESGNVKLTVTCTTNSIYIKSVAITAL